MADEKASQKVKFSTSSEISPDEAAVSHKSVFDAAVSNRKAKFKTAPAQTSEDGAHMEEKTSLSSTWPKKKKASVAFGRARWEPSKKTSIAFGASRSEPSAKKKRSKRSVADEEVGELKKAIVQDEATFTSATLLIQKNFRRMKETRHVELIRMIYSEARKEHMKRRTSRDLSAESEASGEGATRSSVKSIGERWRSIRKEVCIDIGSAVKKCMRAYKTLNSMKHDTIRRERAKKVRQRLRAASIFQSSGGGGDMWSSLQGSLASYDEEDSEGDEDSVFGVCPAGHELIEFETPSDRFSCSNCGRGFPAGCRAFRCNQCNYDKCVKKCKSKEEKALEEQERERRKIASELHQMDDNSLYAADKAARKIQEVWSKGLLQRLKSRMRVVMKVGTLSRAFGSNHSISPSSSNHSNDSTERHHVNVHTDKVKERLRRLQDLSDQERSIQEEQDRKARIASMRAIKFVLRATQPTEKDNPTEEKVAGGPLIQVELDSDERHKAAVEIQRHFRGFRDRLHNDKVAQFYVNRSQSKKGAHQADVGANDDQKQPTVTNLSEWKRARLKAKLPSVKRRKAPVLGKGVNVRIPLDGDSQAELGLELGLVAPGEDKKGQGKEEFQIIVTGITSGAIHTWNLRPGGVKVRPGDRILRVNGESEWKLIIQKLRAPQGKALDIEFDMRTSRQAAESLDIAHHIHMKKSKPKEQSASATSSQKQGEAADGSAVEIAEGTDEDHQIAEGRLGRDNMISEQTSLQVWKGSEFSPSDPEAWSATVPSTFATLLDPLSEVHYNNREKALLPDFLSPDLFGPCLRETISSLSAADAITLIYELQQYPGYSTDADVDFWSELRKACGSNGGQGLWSALVAGATQHGDSAFFDDSGSCSVYLQTLWRVGAAAIYKECKRIVDIMQGWCLGPVNAEWGRQLVRLEEAMGWCAQNLDAMRVRCGNLTSWRGPMSTEGAEFAAATAHAAAAVCATPQLPAGKASRWATLQPRAREEVCGLMAVRSQHALEVLHSERDLLKVKRQELEESSISSIGLRRPAVLSARQQHVAAARRAKAVASATTEGHLLSFDTWRHMAGDVDVQLGFGTPRSGACSKNRLARRGHMAPSMQRLRV